jgi:hypothetical protein
VLAFARLRRYGYPTLAFLALISSCLLFLRHSDRASARVSPGADFTIACTTLFLRGRHSSTATRRSGKYFVGIGSERRERHEKEADFAQTLGEGSGTEY